MIKNKKIINFFNKLFKLIELYFIVFLVLFIISIFIDIPFFKNNMLLFGVVPFGLLCFIKLFCPNALIDYHSFKFTFNFDFKNFDDFITFLDSKVKKVKLTKIDEQLDNVVLYTRTSNLASLREYYVVFDFNKINDSAEDAISNMSEILRNITQNIDNKRIEKYICGFFVCVKKENEVFHEIINDEWIIPIGEGNTIGDLLIVGCSFEKKKLYFITPKTLNTRFSRYSGNPLLFLFKRVIKIMNLKIKNVKEKTRL